MTHVLTSGQDMVECDVTPAADGSIQVVFRYADGRAGTMCLTGLNTSSQHWRRFVKRLTGRDVVAPRGH